MPVTVKKIVLWRGRVTNRPGALAEVLEPVSAAGADLQVVMGYREHGTQEAVIEMYPVGGRKLTEAAEGAGLAPSAIPAVLVSGGNRAGLAHRVATALAEGPLNIGFLVAQVVGRKYSAVFGFGTEAEADVAVRILRKALASRR
jgi:hypothetical protein